MGQVLHESARTTATIRRVFGLRPAVDADHTAAIDNVIRKLMQEGKRPLTVRLFFSLAHSTIVFVASILIAATAAICRQNKGKTN